MKVYVVLESVECENQEDFSPSIVSVHQSMPDAFQAIVSRQEELGADDSGIEWEEEPIPAVNAVMDGEVYHVYRDLDGMVEHFHIFKKEL